VSSTPTVLPPAVLSTLAPRPAPSPARLIRSALARGGLYLVPVPLAVAASEPLGRVPWPVPVTALAVGWCALSGLVSLATPLAGRAAARLVLAGVVAVMAAWSVLLALAPATLAGGDRAAAFAVSLPALALLGAIAAARATGAELRVLGWSLPVLLVTGLAIAGWPVPDLAAVPEPAPVPRLAAELALLAGVALMVARAFVPALRRRGVGAPSRPGAAELRRSAAAVALAACQAAAVVLVARSGHAAVPAGGVPPALVPLLVALPALELWVGWHLARVTAGLARYDDRDQHVRYVRRLGWTTLTALLPPLTAGAALAGTATRLPAGLSHHPDAPALVLSMASGVLLAGVVATGWLLSARQRPALAAAVTGAPVLAALGLHAGVPGLPATSLTGWGQLLPSVAVGMAVAYAAGLVLAAYVLFDSRSLR
jgi:hypothetical protein